jgi:hypothetical protein
VCPQRTPARKEEETIAMGKQILASIKRAPAAAVCAILLAAPYVNADSFDERSVVTFSGTVAIPGGKTLAAGSYVFKLSPIPIERDLIQISDARTDHVIASLQTVPVWLQNAPNHSMVMLSEAPAGGAPMVHAFVYEGSTRGHEFIYR